VSPLKTEVALGHPAQQIIRWAEKNHVDIILMGHQTRNAFGRWLIGSTPDKVVHHAPARHYCEKQPLYYREPLNF